jgi:hypothetical protein
MAWPAWLATALLAVAAGVLVHADRAGPGRPQPGVALAAGIRDPVLAADRTLSLELRSEHLTFRYVVCIRNGRAYHGHPIIRCNVNFGDPHVEAYCSVISAGRLVTSQQDPAIPCQPDLAGSQPILFPPAPRHRGLSPVRTGATSLRLSQAMQPVPRNCRPISCSR